jgi:hypothetical protein
MGEVPARNRARRLCSIDSAKTSLPPRSFKDAVKGHVIDKNIFDWSLFRELGGTVSQKDRSALQAEGSLNETFIAPVKKCDV